MGTPVVAQSRRPNPLSRPARPFLEMHFELAPAANEVHELRQPLGVPDTRVRHPRTAEPLTRVTAPCGPIAKYSLGATSPVGGGSLRKPNGIGALVPVQLKGGYASGPVLGSRSVPGLFEDPFGLHLENDGAIAVDSSATAAVRPSVNTAGAEAETPTNSLKVRTLSADFAARDQIGPESLGHGALIMCGRILARTGRKTLAEKPYELPHASNSSYLAPGPILAKGLGMVALPRRFRVTGHYRLRKATRRLRSEIEEFVLFWGREWRAADAYHLAVLNRELPTELRDSDLASRARDWIVVVGEDGSLLTCYRHRDAARHLRRKSEQPHRLRSRRGHARS